jgi:hypothetical protein
MADSSASETAVAESAESTFPLESASSSLPPLSFTVPVKSTFCMQTPLAVFFMRAVFWPWQTAASERMARTRAIRFIMSPAWL